MPPTRRCGRRPKPHMNPNCSCGCSRGLDHDHHCVVAMVSVAIVIEIVVVVMVVVHGHTRGCDNCILSWTMSNARINLSTTFDKCQVRTITTGIQRLRILNGPSRSPREPLPSFCLRVNHVTISAIVDVTITMWRQAEPWADVVWWAVVAPLQLHLPLLQQHRTQQRSEI